MHIVKVGARPSAGIWYYVWDGSRWELLVWKTHKSAYSGHPEIWENEIAPKLAKAFGLGATRARALADIPYCMPRGRVDAASMPEAGSSDYDWRLYHGGDFPSGLNLESEQRKLVSAFDLTGPFIRGKAKFEKASHEMMASADKAKFKELTGNDVPY